MKLGSMRKIITKIKIGRELMTRVILGPGLNKTPLNSIYNPFEDDSVGFA